MDFFTTIGAISSAVTIAEQKNKINKNISKILHFVKNGTCRIIVFGAGGTGKTTLSKILSNNEVSDFTYNETPNIEKVKLDSDVYGHFLVAPGQERRVERYWPELFRKLSNNKITGIINVVSSGYHSIEIGNNSYKTTTYYDKERENHFLEDYLTLKKETELEYLKKISEHIKSTEHKFWMFTLVNKQDLWWDNKEDVQSSYTNGKYNEVIESIFKAKALIIHKHVGCN